jgi:hypothetical protein
MNSEHTALIDTRNATVERISSKLIEVRFKPDVKLDAEGVGEVILAKRRLCRSDEPDILTVFPADLDFALNILTVDHSAEHGGCIGSKRLAFVAQNSLNQRLAEIYFRYCPREHETRVFLEEADAKAWLDQATVLN